MQFIALPISLPFSCTCYAPAARETCTMPVPSPERGWGPEHDGPPWASGVSRRPRIVPPVSSASLSSLVICVGSGSATGVLSLEH